MTDGETAADVTMVDTSHVQMDTTQVMDIVMFNLLDVFSIPTVGTNWSHLELQILPILTPFILTLLVKCM